MAVHIVLIALLGICAQFRFILSEHGKKYGRAVLEKGAAAFIFCVIGLGALLSVAGNKTFAAAVVCGLFLSMVGDILLNLRFVFPAVGQKIFLAGIAAFFSAHVLYLSALIPLSQNLLPCIVTGVVVAAALLTWIFRTLTVKLAFKIFGVLYIGAVILMTSVAIGNLIAMPTDGSWMRAVGAVLFAASDIVLIFNTFGKEQKFSLRVTNLSLYYLGQILIASSLYCV